MVDCLKYTTIISCKEKAFKEARIKAIKHAFIFYATLLSGTKCMLYNTGHHVFRHTQCRARLLGRQEK